MAEFQKVMSELNRMCSSYGDSCASCQIEIRKYNIWESCNRWVRYHSEEVECIVMKWSAEHPIKTNGMKFREVFGEDMMVMLTEEHAPLGDWLNAEYKGGQDG